MNIRFRSKRGVDDRENDPVKRQRTSGSRVVFVRGLPSDATESELLSLCCPFAVVERNLLIPQKRQAFVQLPDIESATNLINFYQTRDANIRGQKISFEFSTRDEITDRNDSKGNVKSEITESPHNTEASQHSNAAQHSRNSYGAGQDHGKGGQNSHRNDSGSGRSNGGKRDRSRGGYVGEPNTILMVSVTNIQYEVSVDVIHQVFSKFGTVLKIVTFHRQNEFKALVQLEQVEQAMAAQSELDGRDIYTGCNKLHIVFSKHSELKVEYNNERSRDYTNPNLPTSDPNRPSAQGMLGDPPAGRAPPANYAYNAVGAPPAHPGSQYPPPYDEYGAAPPVDYGPGRDYNTYNNGGSAEYGFNRGGGGGGGGFNPGRRDASFDSSFDSRGGRNGRFGNPSPVVICGGLSENIRGPDAIFTLFGCFGDVIRVKILFKKQDTALVQFDHEQQASTACSMLDGVTLFGRTLKVNFSKHATVSMPRGGDDNFEVQNTKDYTRSPLHRFRRRDGKNLRNIYPPSNLLHLSGIPPEEQNNENKFIDMFSAYGQVQKFRYFEKDRRMALLTMDTMDDAVLAIVSLDNFKFPSTHLRVCFARSPSTPGSGDRDRDHSRDRDRDRDRRGGGGGGGPHHGGPPDHGHGGGGANRSYDQRRYSQPAPHY